MNKKAEGKSQMMMAIKKCSLMHRKKTSVEKQKNKFIKSNVNRGLAWKREHERKRGKVDDSRKRF